MALQELHFGGLSALLADERVNLGEAIEAHNCYVDNGTVRGRNGYRAIIGSGSTPTQLTGTTPQALARYRDGADFARTIAVIGGSIISITDPTSETASDGTQLTLSTPFQGGDYISCAQLGRYMYVASNQQRANWYRVTPALTVETMGFLEKGVKPTNTTTGLSLVKVTALAAPGRAGGAVETLAFTDWHTVDDGAGNKCPISGNLTYNFGSDQDLSGVNWICVVVAAPTNSRGGSGGRVDVALATGAGNFETLGQVYDTPGGGSINYVYFNINALSTTTRSAARRIRFTLTKAADYWGIHGYMFIPGAPGFGPQKYRVTFQNSTTLQESEPTDELEIQFTYDAVSVPIYHNVYADRTTFIDGGQGSLDPDAANRQRCFNVGGGLALPSRYEFAAVATINGNIPSGSRHPSADRVRLWRLTPTGWRLVKSVTLTGGETTYSIRDDVGSKTESNALWEAKGPPPQVNTMCSWGGRLVSGFGNTVNISDYVPVNRDAEPYPQFSLIPVDKTDGWSFRIGESEKEQIHTLVSGDAIYVVTNENTYMMPDADPNTLPFRVVNRGNVSRQGAIYCENSLFFASSDGCYMVTNRSDFAELSVGIRRIWANWLDPNNECCMGYQERKLYIFQNTRYLRYDFVTGFWTRGTITHDARYAIMFKDPAVPRNTFLLDTFTDVDGTNLSAHTPEVGGTWAYQAYSTGGHIFEISSAGGARKTPNNFASNVYNNANPLGANVILTYTFYYFDPANDNYEVGWRVPVQATKAGYSIQMQATSSNILLVRTVAGVPTTLATVTFAAAGRVLGTLETWVIEHIGNRIVVFFNGTEIIDFTDTDVAAITTSGKVMLSSTFGRTDPNEEFRSLHGENPGSVTIREQQFWFLTEDRYLARWQEVAPKDLCVGEDDLGGTGIEGWEYSTGYLVSSVPYHISSVYADSGNGDVEAVVYNSADASVFRSQNFPQGEFEFSGYPDFENYKHRFFFRGTNTTELRRVMYGTEGHEKVGT